jgi:selT/selW/selH-like putative selenoprotein
VSAEINEAGAHEVNLVGGSGGIFDVTVDGREVFSKFKLNRFPEPGEISRLLFDSE